MMPANYSALLHLRGSFQDLPYVASTPPSFDTVEEIIDCFPVTDEHIIIASRRSVHLLHVPYQEILWSIFPTHPVVAAALAPHRPLLALASVDGAMLWDLSNGRVTQHLTFSFSEGGALTLGLSEVLAVAPLNDSVQLWDTQSGRLLHTLTDEEGWYAQAPKSLAFSPDGTLLAVGHAEGPNVWLWQVANGQLDKMVEAHPWSHRIRGLAFSPDGKWLIGSEWSTDPEEESMSIWEVSTGKRVDKLPRMAWLPTVSPDGLFVASTCEGSIFVWNLLTRSLDWQPMHDREDIIRLRFSPSGHSLLSCSGNGTIRWWDTQQKQELYRLECVRSGKVSGILSKDGMKCITRIVDGVVQ